MRAASAVTGCLLFVVVAFQTARANSLPTVVQQDVPGVVDQGSASTVDHGSISAIGQGITPIVEQDIIPIVEQGKAGTPPAVPPTVSGPAPAPAPKSASAYLVIGGFNSTGNDTNTTEIRQTSAASWSVTGPLNTQRALSGAVTLPNGKVLVAGGEDNLSNQLTSSELYNPTTGTWTPTGDLNFPRSYFQLVLLPNGSALAIGGFRPNPNPGPPLGQSTTEVFDATTGTWSLAANLNEPRAVQSTTVLGDGTVLTVGGVYDARANATRAGAEYLDLTSGTWRKTGNMTVLRTATSLVSLGSQALVAGGFPFSSVATDSTEVYNQATNSWFPVGTLKQARGAASATVLQNSTVLIAGGYLRGVNATNTAELFNPLTASWSFTGNLTSPRLLFQLLNVPGSSNSQAYAVGGRANLGDTLAPGLRLYETTETYSQSTGSWTPGPSMAEAHSDFNMVIVNV